MADDEGPPAHSREYRPLETPPPIEPEGARSVGSRPRHNQVASYSGMADTVSTEHVQEDESNRPLNRPYYQQTLPSWSPLLTPWRAAGGYLFIGLIFVPLGAFLLADLSSTVELR